MAIMILPIPGLPAIHPGDDLGGMLARAIADAQLGAKPGDILVVCQKVVSKAEDRVVRLDDVEPSPMAVRWAEQHEKDPRVIELVLRESNRIVRMQDGNLIVETGPGWICANAGLDQSNAFEEGTVTLLPVDADGSAEAIRQKLRAELGRDFGVIISDTFGRPWRLGQVEFALGVAGVAALEDLRGESDMNGKELGVTVIGVADELASAAGLVMGKADGHAAVLIRGYQAPDHTVEPEEPLPEGGAGMIRPPENDLFR